MTQELINKYFNSNIGRQVNCLYTTSNNKVFLRLEEANRWANGEDGSEPLKDTNIMVWYPE